MNNISFRILAFMFVSLVLSASCAKPTNDSASTAQSYYEIQNLGDGLFAVSVGNDSTLGKWGLIDKNGNVLVKPELDDVIYFGDDNYASASKNGNDGIIDKSGKVIIPFEYEDTRLISGDKAVLKKNGIAYLYDLKNSKEISHFKIQEDISLDFYNEGIIGAFDNNNHLYGALSENGKVVIPFEYGEMGCISEGLIAVSDITSRHYDNDSSIIDFKVWFIDRNGKTVIKKDFRYFDKENQNFYILDMFKDGYKLVGDKNHKCGVIDREGNLVIPFKYDELEVLDNGKFLACNNVIRDGEEKAHWILVDSKGNERTIAYDNAGMWTHSSDGVFTLFRWLGGDDTTTNYEHWFVDESGEVLPGRRFSEADVMRSGYAIVKLPGDSKYSVISRKGEVLLRNIADNIYDMY